MLNAWIYLTGEVGKLLPREKCQNTKFFLVRILSSEKTPYLDIFHTVFNSVINKTLIRKTSWFFFSWSRSSRSEVFYKEDVLRNFAKFTGKYLCQNLFFKTLARVFSCEFCEVSKNTFLHRTPLVAASGDLSSNIKRLFQKT